MNSNLKALGLALLAAFALSAVVASPASAHFTSGSDATRLTATAASPEQILEIGEPPTESIKCTGVEINPNHPVTIGTNEEVISVRPLYSGCTVTQGSTTVSLTVDMNTCSYVFTTNGEVHIVCETGKKIEFTATGLHLQCLDIPPQTPTTPTVDYTNEGSGTTMDVRIKSTVEGITYERTGACGSGEGNNARITGEVTVTGENATTGAHVEFTKS